MLVRAEEFRQKNEAIQLFENMKNKYEVFGPRMWQMELRKQDELHQGHVKTLQKNNNSKSTDKLGENAAVIEIEKRLKTDINKEMEDFE